MTGDAAGGDGGAQVLGEVRVQQVFFICFICADKAIPPVLQLGPRAGVCVG